jgi:cyanate lyase
MNKRAMTEAVLGAKKQQGLTWASLGEHVGLSEVFVASACYGENTLPPEAAARLCSALGLGDDVKTALSEFPLKGQSLGQTVPTDPLIYRFYEILQVYGLTLKDVISEKFGDGIMSAIDFTLDIAKEDDPKGARVVVTMNGKFLQYKKW